MNLCGEHTRFAKFKKKKMHTEQKKIHNESELSTFAGTCVHHISQKYSTIKNINPGTLPCVTNSIINKFNFSTVRYRARAHNNNIITKIKTQQNK